ncbi:MAG: methyltransferase domain-containing protein [Phenylobacterium sp.]
MADDPAPFGALEPVGRARLLARIRREFDIAEESLSFAGQTLRFTRVADPNAVLDEVCRQETLREELGVQPRRALHMPYWAAVWESGVAIADHMVGREGRAPIAGRRVLDLGCGLGLVGAVMAMLGAKATLADIDTACLLFARLNVLPWAAASRVCRCDWRSDDLLEPFDLIVGADVLYETSQWPHIEAFARRRLAPGGTLVLGEPGRPQARGFPAWLADRGWRMEACEAGVADKHVHIYEAQPD